MSLLGKIAKLDSTLQRGLDNGFAAVFGGRVVPAEIEELIKGSAEDAADAGFPPNVYVVRVSEKDYDSLRAESPSLPEDFADRLSRFSRNNSWQLAGPVVVRIEHDASLRSGQLACDTESTPNPVFATGFDEKEAADMTHSDAQTELFQASSPAQEPAEPAPALVAPTVTLLLQDGSSRTYLVHEGSNIIGRGNDVDLRLPDTGVSRRHAEVTWDGQDAVLTDLQSTNGTLVNDEPVENWLLADGDVITVGHSYIEVRITGVTGKVTGET